MLYFLMREVSVDNGGKSINIFLMRGVGDHLRVQPFSFKMSSDKVVSDQY
jgi:hypothetical protein